MGEARDWGTGLPLKAGMLGKMSQLEVHHIFPKSQLYKRKHKKPDVNALANFCFLTKETNLEILNRLPEDYFPEIEARHPGALASQWIPQDRNLWKVENYLAFLEARKQLLAQEANRQLAALLHGETQWIDTVAPAKAAPIIPGSITDEDEEAELLAVNEWMEEQGLAAGQLTYECADAETGEPAAIFDLAWPSGVQEELSQPAVLLLNEPAETLAVANQFGYRVLTSVAEFKEYISQEIMSELRR
jgi:isopropylmalate/homocitrate/citramalate synthase